ncbi:MAG: hypothetical protein J0I28_06305 [Caulobacterales bacterium]|nr:hypothetical protein [Caulobacterales bacterium]
MLNSISSAFTIWQALESDPKGGSNSKYNSAERLLMTATPVSIAEISIILRMLAHGFAAGGRSDGADCKRMIEMCDRLEAYANSTGPIALAALAQPMRPIGAYHAEHEPTLHEMHSPALRRQAG